MLRCAMRLELSWESVTPTAASAREPTPRRCRGYTAVFCRRRTGTASSNVPPICDHEHGLLGDAAVHRHNPLHAPELCAEGFTMRDMAAHARGNYDSGNRHFHRSSELRQGHRAAYRPMPRRPPRHRQEVLRLEGPLRHSRRRELRENDLGTTQETTMDKAHQGM